MWDTFLNKDVRITKTDGFVKVGKIIAIDDDFVSLRYFDGRCSIIKKSDISQVDFYKGGISG